MPVGRRRVQQLYLDVLTEPNPEDYPLDLDTIFDTVLPRRKGVVLSLRERKSARTWIDELVDTGILVRDHKQDRTKGQFFVTNPTPIDGKTALQRFHDLPPPTDLSPGEQSLVTALVIVDSILLFLFYSYFMPQEFLARLTGTTALGSAVLGLGGWKVIREASSFWDALWDRKTYQLLRTGSATLGVLVAVGVLFPCSVRAVPGATIHVDGKEYGTVPEARSDGERSNQADWVSLYIPWGFRDVTVTKRWHVDHTTWSPQSRVTMFWPKRRSRETHLAAFILFRAKNVSAQPFVGREAAEHQQKLNEQVQTIMLITHCIFNNLGTSHEAHQDKRSRRLPDCEVISTSAASLTVEGQAEHDPLNRSHYLAASCIDSQGRAAKRLPPIALPNSHDHGPDDLKRATVRLCKLVAGELGMVVNENGIRDQYRALSESALKLVRALQLEKELSEAALRVNQASSPTEKRARLIESAPKSARAATQLVKALEPGSRNRSPFRRLSTNTGKDVVHTLVQQGRSAVQVGADPAVVESAKGISAVAQKAARVGNTELARESKEGIQQVADKATQVATQAARSGDEQRASQAVLSLKQVAQQAKKTGDKELSQSLMKKRYAAQLSVALVRYVKEHDATLPRMGDAAAARAAFSFYLEDPAALEPFHTNPVLSRRRLTDIDKPSETVAFYEQNASSDGSRIVVLVDGQVREVPEREWPRLKLASRIP